MVRFLIKYSIGICFAIGAITAFLVAWTTDSAVRWQIRRQESEAGSPVELGTKWRCFDIMSGLPGSAVRYFVHRSGNDFVLLMNRGWGTFDGNSGKEFSKPAGYLPAGVSVDNSGGIWGTSGNSQSHSLFSVGTLGIQARWKEGFSGAVIVRRNGEVWFGSLLFEQIQCWRDGKCIERTAKGLGVVFSFAELADGTLWAFGNRATARLRADKWELWPAEQATSDRYEPFVSGVDSHGQAWCAIRGRIRVGVGGEVREYGDIRLAIDEHFQESGCDGACPLNVNLWAAPDKEHVIADRWIRINGSWHEIRALAQLKEDTILGVYYDITGPLWWFTRNGIYRRDDSTFDDVELRVTSSLH